jgi:ribosomal protein S8
VVEQWIENPRVGGSIPLLGILFKIFMNVSQINFLIKLKNSAKYLVEEIFFVYNKNYDNILSFLYKEGFIQYFFLRNNKLVVGLRYFLGENNLKGVIIISRPSFYKNIRYKDITKIKQTNNVVAVSTDAGILNLYDCKKQKIGGKILFVC